MKKIVPFALLNGLMLWFANISTAQDNAYLQNNPVWQVRSTCSFWPNCVEYDTFNYFLNGDTTLDGMVYQKVFRSGFVQYSWFGPPPAGCSGYEEYEFEDPSFLIRSHEKRIYMWMGQSEEVLYDFDLEVGSVLPVTWNNYAEGITVTAIDSIYTPYGYRKTFALAGDTWSDILIEGIGHYRGLFEPLSIGLECGYELFCFSLNDAAYYPEPGEGCMLTIGINELTATDAVEIFPNPFRDFTTIQLKDGGQLSGLNLYNSMGQQVLVQSTSQNDRIVLERGSLPAGLYFYELTGSGAVLETGKLIVVD